MPGVLIVEALAQAAGVLAIDALGLEGSGKLVYFMGIEGAKFRTPVEPGVLLTLDVEFVQKRASVCKFAGRASIDGKLAAEASFTAMIADPPRSEEHTSELQSLMRISYAVFCLKNKKIHTIPPQLS